MTGFCTVCGNSLELTGKCPKGHLVSRPVAAAVGAVPGSAPYPTRSTTGLGPLPKASTARRFLGSGIEYIAYCIGVWVITLLDLVSGGILGILALFLAGLIFLRDFNGGAFSISKRVSRMRVVDYRTGHATSNTQAIVRNSYYLVLPIIATFIPLLDTVTSIFFMLFIGLDIMMVMASPKGRRLGDLLARTQVVEARS